MRNAATYLLLAFVAMAGLAESAGACSIIAQSDAERREANRAALKKAKRVTTGADCAFVNGGLYDNYSGGPAQYLGDERFYQVLNTLDGKITDVMVVDCGEGSVTRLMSGYVKNARYITNSCGGEHGDLYPLVAPRGPMTLKEGKSLADLEKIARKTGKARVDETLAGMRLDDMGRLLPKRLRVDFLCGCHLYYPESKGAKS